MADQKRIGIIGIIALGALFCLLSVAPSHSATVSVGDSIVFSGAPDRLSWEGGAFYIKDTTSGFEWNSFCLEKTEYINFGGTFTVSNVGPSAIQGGVGNSGTPGVTGKLGLTDPISSQTAYLYYLYATGGISDLTGAGTGDQQKALQNVFWYLENEISSLPTDSHGYGIAYQALANSAVNGNYYGVAVVNPTYLSGKPAQSQLVYVPEAGALLLFGTGLIGLIGYRRVRRMQ